MKSHIFWVRLVLGAVGVEITSILILVVFVAIFGPREIVAAQAFAEKSGVWVGPIAGALLSLTGAFLIARRLSASRVLHGALFGVCVVFVDVAILLAMRAPFAWILLVSNVAKLIAGYLGGVWAARSRLA